MPLPNKNALLDELNISNALNNSNGKYTAASWSTFTTTRTNAQNIYNASWNPQSMVDSARTSLYNARISLVFQDYYVNLTLFDYPCSAMEFYGGSYNGTNFNRNAGYFGSGVVRVGRWITGSEDEINRAFCRYYKPSLSVPQVKRVTMSWAAGNYCRMLYTISSISGLSGINLAQCATGGTYVDVGAASSYDVTTLIVNAINNGSNAYIDIEFRHNLDTSQGVNGGLTNGQLYQFGIPTITITYNLT